MIQFTSELYREYKPDPLQRYDNAVSRVENENGEQAEKLTGKLFSEVLNFIEENRKEFRESDESELARQSADSASEYRKESREYTELEYKNHETEMKPQGVQQEMHDETISSNDFSPRVTSSNNQGSGLQADDTSVVVEEDSAETVEQGKGFSFGEVESSVSAIQQRASEADTMISHIQQSQESISVNNPVTDPTQKDASKRSS